MEYKIKFVIDEQGLNDAIGLEFVSVMTDKDGEDRISNVFPFKATGREGNLYTFEAIVEASGSRHLQDRCEDVSQEREPASPPGLLLCEVALISLSR